eukprot:3730213-Pleurochrysis_carterae.AAC.1
MDQNGGQVEPRADPRLRQACHRMTASSRPCVWVTARNSKGGRCSKGWQAGTQGATVCHNINELPQVVATPR